MTQSSIDLIARREKFTNFLKIHNACFLLLRNPDIAEQFSTGGDVDLLVKDVDAQYVTIADVLGEPRRVVRRYYVWQLHYPWGKVDLIPFASWNGFKYLSNDEVWCSSWIDEHGYRRANHTDEAIISWLSSLLWGGFFKKRYSSNILESWQKDKLVFKERLKQVFGVRTAEEITQLFDNKRPAETQYMVSKLRRKCVYRALIRNFIPTTISFMKHWLKEIQLHIKPPMPWFAFLGADGAGKSTIIEGVVKRLKADGVTADLYHLRPKSFKGNTEVGATAEAPHDQIPRGQFMSFVKLCFLIADWWVGYLTKILHSRAQAKCVIFDRYYGDLLVDPIRYRYGGSMTLARWMLKLLPKPDAVYLLSAPAATLYARKQEIELDMLGEIVLGYENYIAALGSGRLIDVDRSVEEIIDEVYSGMQMKMQKMSGK